MRKPFQTLLLRWQPVPPTLPQAKELLRHRLDELKAVTKKTQGTNAEAVELLFAWNKKWGCEWEKHDLLAAWDAVK